MREASHVSNAPVIHFELATENIMQINTARLGDMNTSINIEITQESFKETRLQTSRRPLPRLQTGLHDMNHLRFLAFITLNTILFYGSLNHITLKIIYEQWLCHSKSPSQYEEPTNASPTRMHT